MQISEGIIALGLRSFGPSVSKDNTLLRRRRRRHRCCLSSLTADRRVPSYDPRINCGKHFGSSSFLVCEWRMCIILQIVLSLIQKSLNILIAYVALSSRTKIFKGQLKSPRSFTQLTRIISTVQSQTITLMKPLENSSAASRHSALSRSGYRSAGSTRLRVIFGVLYQM